MGEYAAGTIVTSAVHEIISTKKQEIKIGAETYIADPNNQNIVKN